MKTKRLLITWACLTFMAAGSYAQFSGGNGTQVSPYRISSKADLEAMAKVTNTERLYFLLTQDLNTVTTLIPSFSGHFDGGGHEIKVNIHTVASSGLFQQLWGEVENLTVSGMVAGLTSVGGIAAQVYGSIKNCHNKAKIYSEGSFAAKRYKGGIAGICENSAIISNCYNTGEISSAYVHWDNLYVGGIAGWLRGKEAIITNCYNTGNLPGPINIGLVTHYYPGGICGLVDNAKIEHCFATMADLVAQSAYDAGRIYAQSESGASPSVTNCYALSSSTINGGPVLSENTANDRHGKSTPASSLQSESWITANLGWDFGTVWKAQSNGYPLLAFESASASANEAIPSLQCRIYPNPAQEYVYITAASPVRKVEIYTLAGQLALSVSKGAENGVHISSLPSGIYIIRIYAGNAVAAEKLIVRK